MAEHAAPAIPADATELSRPFWEAAARGLLIRPVCDRCGRATFPPQLACPHCCGEAWTWVPSAGRGRVYSATTVHRAPGPGFSVPYVVAIVDLDDEGWSLLTNLVECDTARVLIGLAVALRWGRGPDGRALPTFAPR